MNAITLCHTREQATITDFGLQLIFARIKLNVGISFHVFFLDPPCIVGITVTELLNDFRLVTCVATGKPKPVFDWIDLNEAAFPSNPSFNHNGSLLIKKQRIKTMKFICNASNVYGWTVALVAGI